MIAEKDPQIKNATRTLYRASTEDRIRNLCEGREKGEKTLRSLQLKLQQSKEEVAYLRAELAALQQQKNNNFAPSYFFLDGAKLYFVLYLLSFFLPVNTFCI